jgi:hypothetical protein
VARELVGTDLLCQATLLVGLLCNRRAFMDTKLTELVTVTRNIALYLSCLHFGIPFGWFINFSKVDLVFLKLSIAPAISTSSLWGS